MKPPLMTTPDRVDGRRLRSLYVPELRQLLDMRVANYHRHLDSFRNDSCAANNFNYICEIIEVLNALQNADDVHRDGGEVRWQRVLTLFVPPFYADHREGSFRDGDGI